MSDMFETEDSYSQFYVYPGQEAGLLNYLIGCSRHHNGNESIFISTWQSGHKGTVARVLGDENKGNIKRFQHRTEQIIRRRSYDYATKRVVVNKWQL